MSAEPLVALTRRNTIRKMAMEDMLATCRKSSWPRASHEMEAFSREAVRRATEAYDAVMAVEIPDA